MIHETTESTAPARPRSRRVASQAVVAATLLAAMMWPAAAAATDSKILPATVCQVWIPGGATATEVTELRNSVRYSVNGRAENWHATKTLTLVCPLVRDNTASPPNWVRVYFLDAYPGAGANGKGIVKCRVRSNNEWGVWEVDDDYSDSEGADGGDGDLELLDVDDEVSDGNYTLTCVIPPVYGTAKSSIGSIRYEEP